MNAEQLAACLDCPPTRAALWLPHLLQAFACYDITSPRRQAAFLAQVGEETDAFRKLEEDLHYSARGLVATWPSRFDLATAEAFARQPEKIANRVYAGRNGNGNEASGDGWKYHGRGLLQITFRENYDDCGRAIGQDLLARPELLLEPLGASMSAGWFWWSRNLNTRADLDQFKKITAVINGSAVDNQDRLGRWALAKKILEV